MKWFVLGDLPNTPMKRYAVLDHGCIVDVTVSQPGEERDRVERPAHLRFKRAAAPDVHVKPVNAQQFTLGNGERARRPTWRRAGRTAAPQ